MLEQYENDMAEIERLEALLVKCKTTGCQQSDLDKTGLEGIEFINANG